MLVKWFWHVLTIHMWRGKYCSLEFLVGWTSQVLQGNQGGSRHTFGCHPGLPIRHGNGSYGSVESFTSLLASNGWRHTGHALLCFLPETDHLALAVGSAGPRCFTTQILGIKNIILDCQIPSFLVKVRDLNAYSYPEHPKYNGKTCAKTVITISLQFWTPVIKRGYQ